VSTNITAFAVSILGGSINGSSGGLAISKFMSVAGGQLKNVNLTIDPSAAMTFVGDEDVPLSGVVTNHGRIKFTGHGGIIPVTSSATKEMRDGSPPDIHANIFDGFLAVIHNIGEMIFHRPSVKAKDPAPPPAEPPAVPLARGVTVAALENLGHIVSTDGATIVATDGATVHGPDGTTLLGQDGNSLIGQDGSSLVPHEGGSVIAAPLIGQDGTSLIGQDGSSIVSRDGASLRVQSGSAAKTSTTVAAATAGSGFTQSGGETDLHNLLVIGPVTLNAGVLSGAGVIFGDVTNNAGFVSPGHSAGRISVVGNYAQGADGTLIVESGGSSAGQFDQLFVTGSASLGGKLDIRAINGYTPDPADTFGPLGYKSVSGSFSSAGSNATVGFNTNGALATNNTALPQPRAGQPFNIATRLQIQGGNNGLIGGFIISGPSGSTKKVLIRGIGPSLAKFGIPGVLADPLLELHDGAGGLIVANDNWQSGDTSQVPTDFQPADPKESVIVQTLAPGAYTAILKGASGEIGVGLAEVYDFDKTSAAQLANIATRGFVQTNDNVMIAGFIIGGTEPAKVLVRVTGPTLSKFGITGQLDDPTLELHDGNGAVISNDDWRASQESDILASTLQPADDREPAILATLVPGSYTAVVRGKADATGVAVVEAYNVK
jgi:hypothetical protein